MKFIKRLFRKRESEQELLEIVITWIDTPDWLQSQRFLEVHAAELLTDEVFIALQMLQMANPDNPIIDTHVQILQRCAQVGIPTAYAELRNRETTQSPANLQRLFQEIGRLSRPQEMPYRIKICQQALELVSRRDNSETWGILHGELGISMWQNPTGNRAKNVEQAIHHFTLALEAFDRQTRAEQWALTHNNLGNALRTRILGNRSENIEQALYHFTQALEVFTYQVDPYMWAVLQNNLGIVYCERILGNRSENLERGIQSYFKALEVRTQKEYPEEWAMTHHNLATALKNRLEGSREENLEQAIHHFNLSLEVRTKQMFPADWAMTHGNLALVYVDRIHGDKAENVEQAIYHDLQALTTYSQKVFPVEWAGTQHNLGMCFSERKREDRAENIERAIECFSEALKIYTKRDHPLAWAMTQNSLGVAYQDRIRGSKAENQERAIYILNQALEILTRENSPLGWADVQNNLAVIYSTRLQGNQSKNTELAVYHYSQALKICTPELFPTECRNIQRNLGNLLFERQRWSDAIPFFLTVIEKGDVFVKLALSSLGQKAEMSETEQLHTRTAYAQWQLGQYDVALVTLEQGKTRLLAQSMAYNEEILIQLSPPERDRLHILHQEITALEAELRLPSQQRRDDHIIMVGLRSARNALHVYIDSLHAKYPDFMPMKLELSELLELIPPKGALVAPFITVHGGGVFVVPYGTPKITNDHIVPLPSLNTGDLFELLRGSDPTSASNGWLVSYVHFIEEPNQTTQNIWFQEISSITSTLWDVLMGPIHQRLQKLKLDIGTPVVLIPQGGLGLLPLHAAWRQVDDHPRYFCDDYTITYAPSAHILNLSLQRAGQSERQARSLFAIINPTRDLPYTNAEGDAIAQLVPYTKQTILRESEAAEDRFLAAARGHAYIHYAGHSYFNPLDPTQSGLQLADKAYTLADILRELDLSGCRLVTLSACETGITEFQQAPDEYVGLPAGFLQAGAPAVVSTLWAVNDLSTMLLMERFYQLHLQDGLEFAPALRQAQLWLRDVTAGELAERFGEERMKLKGNRLTLTEAGDYWRRFAAMEPEERPFAHPYYWAAFTFTGA